MLELLYRDKIHYYKYTSCHHPALIDSSLLMVQNRLASLTALPVHSIERKSFKNSTRRVKFIDIIMMCAFLKKRLCLFESNSIVCFLILLDFKCLNFKFKFALHIKYFWNWHKKILYVSDT